MRKILITGATSGFGKLMVSDFLKRGDLVIASGRNLGARKEIFQHERSIYHDRLVEFDLDVTNLDQVENTFEVINKQFGHLDILINNAGYGSFGALEDLEDKEIRYQMEVNFFGTLHVTRAFLPLLRQAKGKIFNFSSVFGFMGFPLTSLYCASKFAVEGLTESLRSELAPFGVQVCLIEPGGYNTNFGPNINWNSKRMDSLYQAQLKNYHHLHLSMASKRIQDPAEVSKGIVELSIKNRLPMRKIYGLDGKFAYLSRTLLPTVIYFSGLDFILKKIFLRK